MKPRCPAQRLCLQGFTLVEVLIALTLFSLILSSLFSGLYAAGRNWRGSEVRVEENDDRRLGMELIRRLIEEAVPLQLNQTGGSRLLFEGRPDVLQFATPLPAHAGGGGIYWVKLDLIRGDDDTTRLRLRYRPVDPEMDFFAPQQDEKADSMPLMDGIASLAFEYYGTGKPDSPPRWYRRWPDNRRLPVAIKVTLSPGDPKRSMPELIATVRAPARSGQSQFMIYANAQAQ